MANHILGVLERANMSIYAGNFQSRNVAKVPLSFLWCVPMRISREVLDALQNIIFGMYQSPHKRVEI
jgi:hypothetical protein